MKFKKSRLSTLGALLLGLCIFTSFNIAQAAYWYTMYPVVYVLGPFDQHISGNTYSLKYADGNSLVISNGDYIKNARVELYVTTQNSHGGTPLATGYKVKVMAPNGIGKIELLLYYDDPFWNGPPFDCWVTVAVYYYLSPGVWYTYESYSQSPYHIIGNPFVWWYPGLGHFPVDDCEMRMYIIMTGFGGTDALIYFDQAITYVWI